MTIISVRNNYKLNQSSILQQSSTARTSDGANICNDKKLQIRPPLKLSAMCMPATPLHYDSFNNYVLGKPFAITKTTRCPVHIHHSANVRNDTKLWPFVIFAQVPPATTAFIRHTTSSAYPIRRPTRNQCPRRHQNLLTQSEHFYALATHVLLAHASYPYFLPRIIRVVATAAPPPSGTGSYPAPRRMPYTVQLELIISHSTYKCASSIFLYGVLPRT